MSKYLDRINSPADLKKLDVKELPALADEIRTLIIDTVSKTGGHLASNLGTVELTVAMHYVFDFQNDHLLWDVGHQCYTHKILTGRKNKFNKLRTPDGVSGFPDPKESIYDRFEVGHSGTSISTALGIGLAAEHLNRKEKIVAMVGDASLVNGLSFEALNNLQRLKRQMMVVLNDNSMAIDVTQGAIAKMFSAVRLSHTYEEIVKTTKNILEHVPLIGKKVENAIERFKKTIRMSLPASQLFESLNLAYFGPVDGHDIQSLVEIFKALKELQHPAVLHVYTKKGKGFTPAKEDPCKFHSTGPFEVNGKLTVPAKTSGKSYTKAFGDAIVESAQKDERLIAITSAMPDGTGLNNFRQEFPKRYFDVGIAESVAVDIAAGQAKLGLRPFVCVYSTFLQRSFDQIAHEVSLQNLPVTFCIDRAGLVGSDGPTHHGMLDISYTRTLPNMVVIAPSCEKEIKLAIEYSLRHNAPLAIRYPRDIVPIETDDFTPCFVDFETGKSVTVIENNSDIVLVSYGATLINAIEAAEVLETENIMVDVINARFAKPIDNKIIDLIKAGKHIITIEEHSKTGGFGSAILETLADTVDNNSNLDTKKLYGGITVLAGPDAYIERGNRDLQQNEIGISKDKIIETVKKIIEKRAK